MMKRLVIKVGGDLAGDSGQLPALAKDLLELRSKWQVVVVHGGGPQATAMTKRLGLTPVLKGGRRVTNAETLEVVKMILGGSVNLDLSLALMAQGLNAVGISGVADRTIQAVKRPPRIVSGGGPDPIDFGFVGDIVHVEPALLELLLGAGKLPVMNSLGSDERGQVYNINADIAATRVAKALGATLALTTGGVRGVLADKDKPETKLDTLTRAQAHAAIKEGIIQGGMIPKIEESLQVLSQGVDRIHILGALRPGDLCQELEAPGSVGTALLEG